ncbi:LytTR family transcriptional regulator DNA-binding domain-containing protein [Spirosoma jeollabukense]
MTHIQLPGCESPILIDSILWMKGEANYTRIHHVDGHVSLVTKSLNYFTSFAGLVRVHRSAIVNSLYVHRLAYTKGRWGWVYLVNGKVVAVSRTYLPLLISLFPHGPIEEEL